MHTIKTSPKGLKKPYGESLFFVQISLCGALETHPTGKQTRESNHTIKKDSQKAVKYRLYHAFPKFISIK